MKRLSLTFLLLLLCPLCAAQQPDVRVRLLSLYHLTRVEIEPQGPVKISIGENRLIQSSGFSIKASDDMVEMQELRGNHTRLTGDFRVVSGPVPVEHIRGTLEISTRAGFLQLVAAFPLETYVTLALQGETAGAMPPDALKAMAVAIRSYTARFRDRHKDDGFDFCDTTHCQFIRLETQRAVAAAVEETAGEVLWDKGTPLAAYYHRDCGGQTESAAVVWNDQRSGSLLSHSDPYCSRASKPWRSEVARSDLQNALARAELQAPPGWDRIRVIERTPSGRAQLLRLSHGPSGGTTLSASSLRFAVGRSLGWMTLKSDLYDVTSQGDRLLFTGKGVGHGVGLCQVGAAEMARQGKSYREILSFYYPGAEVGRAARNIPWVSASVDNLDLRGVEKDDIVRVQGMAKQAMEDAQHLSGLSFPARPLIEIFSTVAMFRDATGEPGWVAASTRHQRIRLQPPKILGDRLPSVLRHEFLHMLIEAHAAADTPLWLREGLVVYLAGETVFGDVHMSASEMENAISSRRSDTAVRLAYAQAGSAVGGLERRYGRDQVISWLRNGHPPEPAENRP